MAEMALGVDIGGTKIGLVLINTQGEVLARDRIPTQPEAGPDAMIARIAQRLEALAAPFDGTVSGVGIGSAGIIDADAGVVRNAVNLGWRDVPVCAMLAGALRHDWPVYIENDVMALVLGERHFGAAQGYDDLVYVALGTGLGTAAVLGGKPGCVARHLPIELGHLSLFDNGRLCNCGQYGCLETVVSGRGMLMSVAAYAAEYPQSPLAQHAHVDTALVIEQAWAGDPLACRVVDEVRHWLGYALVWLNTILSPQVIVLGGGMGQALVPLILDDVRIYVEQKTLLIPPQIVAAQLEDTAIGAASMAFRSV